MPIPRKGRPKEEIFAELARFKAHDLDWKAGKVWAYVYNPGDEIRELVDQAYTMFLTENALDPTVFPSLLRLEVEVVRMLADLLRGDEKVVGNVTSGGTESILLAVKAARDWARAERPEITAPEMVLPMTAHAAFHKAAHYFGIKPVLVPFNPETYRADVEAMRKAITENTILLVASAPCYSHGVVDPIEEIGALAREEGLLFHVDACVGGIHLSFMRKMGYPVPDFDFAVPGVTSISVDMHKYGYAAKGCSVILYRDKELRRHQIFACSETTGYALINPTVLSSRTGAPIAGAWAILNYLGEEGYCHIVRAVQEATRRLMDGINAIEGLRVLGKPDMCMFSFTSDTINVFQLADEMRRRGWYLQPQLSTPLSPRSLHVSVTYGSIHAVEALLADLKEAVETVRKIPQPDPQLVQAVATALMENPSPEAIARVLSGLGIKTTELPGDTAFINEVLDTLPDEVVNHLLIFYFNDLYA
ncbi:MAG: aspartate aminotransferase family protein [Anaerolineae bacterium]|nr:aspartate aminotransferase family protein [Anaerolineae bacterium]MDW8101272.1 aspartate aminotransferase family protein [Anaerolineae bacterium]